MNEPKRIPLIIIVLIALAAVLLVMQVSYADDHYDCNGRGCDDAGATVLTEIAGDDFKALSLSQALGGVEVSGCIVTTQWGIIIYQRQGYRYDVFCLARELDAVGKYADAAAMRCLHKIPTKLYGERCLSVMNFEPPEQEPTDIPISQVPDERYVQQQEEIEYLREENASIVGQIEYITKQIKRAPAPKQQVDAGAARRARSLKAYEEALAKGGEE